MATYRFDWLSLRGFRISSENIECADDQAAVAHALEMLATDRIGHIDVLRNARLVWSSRVEGAEKSRTGQRPNRDQLPGATGGG